MSRTIPLNMRDTTGGDPVRKSPLTLDKKQKNKIARLPISGMIDIRGVKLCWVAIDPPKLQWGLYGV